MARIKTPQPGGGEIVIFDGGERTVYKIKDGEIEVPDDHVAHALAGIPGASLVVPEPPAKSVKPVVPAKES